MINTMKPSQRATKVANVFGSFGYLSILVQWFWWIAVVVLPYLQDSSIKTLLLPSPATEHTAAVSPSLPFGFQLVLGTLALLFSIAVVIYAIYAVPRTIGKAGKSLTQKSAEITVNHVKFHHKPLTKAARKRLFEYLTWTVKLLLIVLPCVLLFLPTHNGVAIPHEVVLAFGAFCAGMSLVWFTIQYLISRFARSDARTIW